MTNTQAVVVEPGRLAIREVAYPTAGPDDALVRVEAISLNLVEVRRSQTAEADYRPDGTSPVWSSRRRRAIEGHIRARVVGRGAAGLRPGITPDAERREG